MDLAIMERKGNLKGCAHQVHVECVRVDLATV
jgi:hypothetical protein